MAVKKIPGYQLLYCRMRTDKYFNGSNGALRVSLMENDFAFDPTTHKSWNDISSHALSSGNGYSPITTDSNLSNLYGEGLMYNDGNGNLVCSARFKYNNSYDSVLWTASGGDIGPTAGAAIWLTSSYTNSGVSYPIAGYIDFGQNITVNDGDTLKLDDCFRFDFVNDSEYIADNLFRAFLYNDSDNNYYPFSIWNSNLPFQTSEMAHIALMKPSFTWDKSIKVWNDISSSDKLSSGNGYSIQSLKNPVQTINYESDKASVSWKWDNIIWIASGGDIGPTSGAIIYANKTNCNLATSPSANEQVNYPILGYIDFLSDITVSDGQTLTVKNIELKISSVF